MQHRTKYWLTLTGQHRIKCRLTQFLALWTNQVIIRVSFISVISEIPNRNLVIVNFKCLSVLILRFSRIVKGAKYPINIKSLAALHMEMPFLPFAFAG